MGSGIGIALLTGCSGGSSSSSATSGTTAGPAPSGQQVYTTFNCANCHVINGQGGRQGPELTHTGAQHNAQWLADHVRNPKTHNPGSRMPTFEGKISEPDLKALGEYLASLK